MQSKVAEIRKSALEACAQAETLQQLSDAKVKFLGKKGELTLVLRSMGQLPSEQRPLFGKLVNEVRDELDSAWEQRETQLAQAEEERRLLGEGLDISLPGRIIRRGTLHPITQIINEAKTIFMQMGYEIVEGPEVELDYYNFEALNIPPDHPARDMQDTFFITEQLLLRSQTSPVQIHTMERRQPPIRIVAPGKVYRADSDISHSPMFHQIEGLVVDRGITFADLKGTLQLFAERMFGAHTKIRLRPSYFPFTEPSAEVDVSCIICAGAGCRVCKETGWLEILGSGMVHPHVLEKVGYDPREVTGFAFGAGIERIAMLKYGIGDIRLLFENDVRFLQQFTS
ncbi:MAG: phenylalanine--tRNA ligase subunit alpha [Bacillota bacterium]|nr:phenylalanine--tRNA ligase subunit alpha [Bacillota bacterium]HHT91015.1 phenylalanine--tRNA ligase subunit alpha [Bacillota bacterium]